MALFTRPPPNPPLCSSSIRRRRRRRRRRLQFLIRGRKAAHTLAFRVVCTRARNSWLLINLQRYDSTSILAAVIHPMSDSLRPPPAAAPRACAPELLAGSLLWSSTMPAFGRNFFVKTNRVVSFLLSPRPLLSHEQMKRFLDSGGSIDKRDSGMLPRVVSSSRVNGSTAGDFPTKKGDPAHLAELQQKYPKVPDLIFQQRLGSGASGEVLLVNDMTNGSNVALKRIVVDLSHLNRVSDQDPLGDVLAEVDCLKILSDKRVVAYKGAAWSSFTAFL